MYNPWNCKRVDTCRCVRTWLKLLQKKQLPLYFNESFWLKATLWYLSRFCFRKEVHLRCFCSFTYLSNSSLGLEFLIGLFRSFLRESRIKVIYLPTCISMLIKNMRHPSKSIILAQCSIASHSSRRKEGWMYRLENNEVKKERQYHMDKNRCVWKGVMKGT